MSATIVVPAYGNLDGLARCIESVDQHTDPQVPLLVIDDCGPQPVPDSFLALPSGRPTELVRNRGNLGFVGTANVAFERCAGDVVLVNSDVTVLPGWFAGLTVAVRSSDRVASASALADRGGILSVPAFEQVTPTVLGAVRRALPPAARLPVAVGHCTWFTRAALDDVGPFDPAFSPGYGEEVDWSLRAAARDWRHVAALHAAVRHAEAGSFGTGRHRDALRRRHELLLARRYPRQFVAVRRFARDRGTELAAALRTIQAIADVA
jgi:GT2 family glycosyltransferase